LRSLALLALLAPALPAAAPVPVVSFEDPAGDADGPGTYQPPGDTQFLAGDFDLRRFAVLTDGDDVVFEVTLGSVVRLPQIENRTNRTPVPFFNGIYLQNLDIYVDTDRAAPGASACIPGRRVAFAGNRTWKAAVVVTPQPGPVRTVLQDALGADAGRVTVAEQVQARGRTVVVRVPAAALGGLPRPSWGYSVQVSGARWERSYDGQDRVRETREPDAYTMPVTTVREAFAFGGAPAASRAHPRVVDVLLPVGIDQRRTLGGYDTKTGSFAQVPFVYADGPDATAPPVAVAPAEPGRILLPENLRPRMVAPPASPGGGWTIADVSGDLVTIAGSSVGVAPLRIGRVLGPGGDVVGRVVVGRVLEGGITASILEGREKIVPGAAVRFDGP